MEMKLPEAWSPLANTIPALGEVHRNAQHKETWNHWQELAEHSLFLTDHTKKEDTEPPPCLLTISILLTALQLLP